MQDTATPVRLAAISGGDPALREAVALRLAAEGFALADDLTAAAALDALIILAEAKAQSFAGTSTADFSAHMGGQLKAAFVALQSGVAAIRAKGGGGAVVVLAPPAGANRSFDGLQQGLRLLAKSAALELGAEGIRVNVILPGAGGGPLGEGPAPVDVAASVAFAVSERSHFMTGADVVVDDGRMAA